MRRVTLYGLDDGTDCLGGGGYEVGKDYLVYASEHDVKDVVVENFFWYGWTDVLPGGSKMLIATACAPGGESSKVREVIRQLGKGRIPARTE